MLELVALLTPAMQGPPQDREKQAWAVVATIVGAVTVARALPAGDQAEAVLDAALDHATKAVTDAE
jgi:TetR/AcrR family transcriptional repressor of nem operon